MGLAQHDSFAEVDGQQMIEAEITEGDLAAVEKRLTTYPYFCVLRLDPTESGDDVVKLMKDLGADPDTMTESRIEIDPDKVASNQTATSFSRTSDAMELHTDSSFMPQPHDLLAFQFVRTSETGGLSLVQTLDDLAPELTDEDKARLREIRMPQGKQDAPVLTEDERGVSVRFNLNQIKKSCETASDRDALMSLAQRFVEASERAPVFAHKAEPGDVILINNRRALHARTAFPENSRRLMLRHRARCDALFQASNA